MSSGKRSRVGRNVVKPIVLAVALALPGAACYAESMTDVVTTRSDQNIHEQYGRDSVYAFSNYAKPYKPEQTGTHSAGFIGNTLDKTKDFFAGAWDKTTGLFKHHEASSSTVARAQYEPQPYGRAGGYTGTDRVEVVGEAPRSYAANSDIVKSSQDVSPLPNDTAARDEALSSRANSTVDTRDMAGNRDTMTGSARDNSAPSSTSSAAASRDNTSSSVTPNDNPPSAAAPSDKASSAVYPEDRKLTPAQRDSAVAPSAGSDIQGQSTMSPAQDQSSMQDQRSMQDQGTGTSGDVVRSGTAATDSSGTAATDNGSAASDNSGRTEGRRFDHPDSAHGQMENDTQTR